MQNVNLDRLAWICAERYFEDRGRDLLSGAENMGREELEKYIDETLEYCRDFVARDLVKSLKMSPFMASNFFPDPNEEYEFCVIFACEVANHLISATPSKIWADA